MPLKSAIWRCLAYFKYRRHFLLKESKEVNVSKWPCIHDGSCLSRLLFIEKFSIRIQFDIIFHFYHNTHINGIKEQQTGRFLNFKTAV